MTFLTISHQIQPFWKPLPCPIRTVCLKASTCPHIGLGCYGCNPNPSRNADDVCRLWEQANRLLAAQKPEDQTDEWLCIDLANALTLLGLKREYSWRNRSIPWLLMLWRLLSPGHPQPWHWLCRISECLSSMREYFCYHTYIILMLRNENILL